MMAFNNNLAYVSLVILVNIVRSRVSSVDWSTFQFQSAVGSFNDAAFTFVYRHDNLFILPDSFARAEVREPVNCGFTSDTALTIGSTTNNATALIVIVAIDWSILTNSVFWTGGDEQGVIQFCVQTSVGIQETLVINQDTTRFTQLVDLASGFGDGESGLVPIPLSGAPTMAAPVSNSGGSPNTDVVPTAQVPSPSDPPIRTPTVGPPESGGEIPSPSVPDVGNPTASPIRPSLINMPSVSNSGTVGGSPIGSPTTGSPILGTPSLGQLISKTGIPSIESDGAPVGGASDGLVGDSPSPNNNSVLTPSPDGLPTSLGIGSTEEATTPSALTPGSVTTAIDYCLIDIETTLFDDALLYTWAPTKEDSTAVPGALCVYTRQPMSLEDLKQELVAQMEETRRGRLLIRRIQKKTSDDLLPFNPSTSTLCDSI